jgi:hypothetical protein
LEHWNGQKVFQLTAREICQQIGPLIAERIDDSFATKEYWIDQLQLSLCINHDVARPNVGAAPEPKSGAVRKQHEQAGAKDGKVGVYDRVERPSGGRHVAPVVSDRESSTETPMPPLRPLGTASPSRRHSHPGVEA